jgi:protein-S-isoprenylcysteine O-methyltransferase Ste14
MARATYLLYGLVAYAIFFATFLYLVAFVGSLPGAPVTVDRGGPSTDLAVAIAIDLALIALFGVQHSVMARPGFKARWTRLVPGPIERSTYVLAASLVLILLYLLWRPIPGTIWRVENDVGAAILWALFALGWLIVLVSTFLISHFELFGLSQVWGHARGTQAAPPVFRQPFFYRHVRHPIYSGFLLAFWATPHMTAGHLLLAGGITVYILIAIRYEERDLVGLFGADYEAYRTRVGMLAPRVGRRKAG